MKDILQRVAYLKGLADGMKINEQKDEGKLLLETIDVLEELALAIEDIDYRQDLIVEDIDDIDEDLADLEEFVYDLDIDSYTDFDDFDFENIENNYLDDFDFFDDKEDDEDEDFEEDYIFEDEETNDEIENLE